MSLKETEQQPKSGGMSEAQKQRVGGYLEDFRKSNGGCILCGKKIPGDGYNFVPETEDGHIQLQVFGMCEGHMMLHNSDTLTEREIAALMPAAVSERVANPRLVVVDFNKDSEELKYAA